MKRTAAPKIPPALVHNTALCKQFYQIVCFANISDILFGKQSRSLLCHDTLKLHPTRSCVTHTLKL
ncbi:MAG: hypothetical protein U0O24_00545, partial [Eggerthellaceae bacterium]